LAESYPDHRWPTLIAGAITGLIHQANLARAAGRDAIDPQVKAELVAQYRYGVMVGLKVIPRVQDGKQLAFRHLLEVLDQREPDVLRFAEDLRVPPTSNLAERAVRPAKTQQKISGRLTSEKITAYRYRIAGHTATAAKHGVKILDAIRDALRGNPWMPPDPAPA
jgi:hypothetical protein